MLSAEILKEAEQRRLAWRCRRGMLELDIVLQRFVRDHFDSLTLAEMSQLDDLLEMPDNAFWDLIQGVGMQGVRAQQLAAQQHTVLEKLRASRPPAEQETA
ncbi:MAG TPA: succinate dehydrogenase assembly factor 2 [Methylophilus sp.]